jgi:hypothetical protein
MNDETRFDGIRPYRDPEVNAVLKGLINEPIIDELLKTVYPELSLADVKGHIMSVKSIREFQTKIIYPASRNLLDKSSTSFTSDGLERLNKDESYLYISNHIDITLDPSLVNFALHENGFETVEIAIGDNLVGKKWVRDLVRLNKSFIVRRNLSHRELVAASRLLSDYILYTLTTRHQSVWIAQREGRAKDGNHRTQQGLLHMLAMAGKEGLEHHFRALNIVPVSVSYELDPCGPDKVRSLYAERYMGGYRKSEGEDQLAMKKGILGSKGKVHVSFGKPLNILMSGRSLAENKQDFTQQICQLIDHEIIANYRLSKSNYISFDLYHGVDRYSKHYTQSEKDAFSGEIEKRLAGLEGDQAILRKIFYEKYARPVINFNEMIRERQSD